MARKSFDLSVNQKTSIFRRPSAFALTQAVLDERLVLVVGTKLEAYYREQLLPPFVAAYGEVAAACVQLGRRVGGQPGCQVSMAGACCNEHTLRSIG